METFFTGNIMGGPNIIRTSPYTSRLPAQLPPISSLAHASPSNGDSNAVGSKSIEKPVEGLSHHQRCSSESCLLEQPYWLDDLLNEPETMVHKGHRRSMSDSSAYIDLEANAFDTNGESLVHLMDPSHASFEKRPISSDKEHTKVTPNDSEGLLTTAIKKPEQENSFTQSLVGSVERTNGLQMKPFMSKAEAKRAKQQSAHRSRVRKLQYIAELERTIEVLQTEGSAVSAELEFLDQHNLLLGMENRALRQRLDNLSQEQVIKQLEQEMLEREIARLQTLYHLQLLQHQQQHKHEHSRPRRTRNQDLDAEFANLSIKK